MNIFWELSMTKVWSGGETGAAVPFEIDINRFGCYARELKIKNKYTFEMKHFFEVVSIVSLVLDTQNTKIK